jgi:hypothetical protein
MAGYRCEPGCECNKHKGHGQKKGRKRVGTPGVMARHDRVRYERGRADLYDCVSCQEVQARDWAQVHGGDPLDVFAYQPMCRRCHILYDNPGRTMSAIMRAKRMGGDAR